MTTAQYTKNWHIGAYNCVTALSTAIWKLKAERLLVFCARLAGVEIPDELEIHRITRFYHSYIMVSFWKNFYTSREQVIADIESVLEDILKLCTANLDSLTREERSLFMDEYSSLADARVRLNKSTSNSTLTGTLDTCYLLWLSLKTEFHKSAATESRKSSIALVDPDPSYRTPSSECSITTQSNLTMTNGNGSYPSPSNPSTGHETTSNTSAVSTEGSPDVPPADKDCMIFGPDSSIGSPTFNIDSQEATGATHTFPGDNSPLGLSPHRLPPAGAHQLQTAPTMKRERVMYFAPGTVTGSPTFNIRSPRGSGAIEQVVPQHSEVLTEPFR
ncbi:hypothetical protein BDR07DRAFT_1375355 [Suillus spraguei]|nr:hypothetical protein BDR07DRAFT_1375355 [Suillus spraguei]